MLAGAVLVGMLTLGTVPGAPPQRAVVACGTETLEPGGAVEAPGMSLAGV